MPDEFGDSKYDKSLNWEEVIRNDRSLEDYRAEKQGHAEQFANNLANTGTIALTTFADATVGIAAGLVNMIVNPEADPNLN